MIPGRGASPGRALGGTLAALLLIAAVPWSGCAPAADAPSGVEVERRTWQMGTSLAVRVHAPDRDGGIETAEAVFEEVARIESLISSWDTASGLSGLNGSPVGDPVRIEPELFDLLHRADRLAEEVGRAFDPAVGPLVDAWDLRGEGRTPSPDELDRALEAVRAGFHFDPDAGVVTRRHPDAWIDAGGFGKGAALDAVARVLEERELHGALVDFGGQALTLGERPEGGPWRIGVAHPERRQDFVVELRLGSGLSVATSGGSERPGHLLDPRSGGQLAPWGSVTVVSADPILADALATAFFVLGPEAALEWASDRTEFGLLILEARPTGLRARWTPAMEPFLDDASAEALRAPAEDRDTAGPQARALRLKPGSTAS
jgi:thiamine biosynthesis lipoprotein